MLCLWMVAGAEMLLVSSTAPERAQPHARHISRMERFCLARGERMRSRDGSCESSSFSHMPRIAMFYPLIAPIHHLLSSCFGRVLPPSPESPVGRM
jgi:hypothetical protein